MQVSRMSKVGWRTRAASICEQLTQQGNHNVVWGRRYRNHARSNIKNAKPDIRWVGRAWVGLDQRKARGWRVQRGVVDAHAARQPQVGQQHTVLHIHAAMNTF